MIIQITRRGAMWPVPPVRRTDFESKVFADSPAGLEHEALSRAAEFFGQEAGLEVLRDYTARPAQDFDGTAKAYAAIIRVRGPKAER
jgi:hypothetical protein